MTKLTTPPTKTAVDYDQWAGDLVAAGVGVSHAYIDPGQGARVTLYVALRRRGFKASLSEAEDGACHITLLGTTDAPKEYPTKDAVDYDQWGEAILSAGVGQVHFYADETAAAGAALVQHVKRRWGAKASVKTVRPGHRMVVLLDAGSYPELQPRPDAQD